MNDSTDKWTSAEPVTARDPNWERDLITKIASAAVVEQRRARRWSIFFKFLLFGYLFTLLGMVLWPMIFDSKPSLGDDHVAVVRVEGVIAGDEDASAENIITGLRNAFEDDNTAAVMLRINSPGGSPVQAGQIYGEIMRLRQEYPDTPIYAVALDVCASGGYYIAAAADKIYADKASVIGSIGVRADSFGFVEAMDKLGVERRLYTAGENKAFLDPFVPPDPASVGHLQAMLGQIHQQFIDAVQKGRGDRLQTSENLFTGLVWTGARSVEIGLIDELASPQMVAEDIVGVEKMRDFTPRKQLLDELLNEVRVTFSGMLSDTLSAPPSLR